MADAKEFAREMTVAGETFKLRMSPQDVKYMKHELKIDFRTMSQKDGDLVAAIEQMPKIATAMTRNGGQHKNRDVDTMVAFFDDNLDWPHFKIIQSFVSATMAQFVEPEKND